MKRILSAAGLALTFLLLPGIALADYSAINDAVNVVGGYLPNLSNYGAGSLCDAIDGPCGFAAIASTILIRLRPVLTIAGILAMSIAGIRMIIGQEDDALAKSRAVMSACIAGIMLAYLIEPFMAAFYGQSGSVQRGGMAQGAAILSIEVQGIINWALVIAASLAVLMIILSALKAMQPSTATSEEGITHIRKTVLSVIFGVLLLSIRFALANAIGNQTNNPHALILVGVNIIAYIMSFFALAAVCVLVYAGIQLVLSWGNAEAMTRAKNILLRSIIGSIVFILSLALVKFVIEPGIS